MVRLLLGRGSDVNKGDDQEGTALHAAAAYGRADVVAVLLELGASPGLENRIGRSPLHEAVSGNHVGAVKILIKKGAVLADDDPAQLALAPILHELDVDQMQEELRAAEKAGGFVKQLEAAQQAFADAQAEYIWLERLRERRNAGDALAALETELEASREAVKAAEAIEQQIRDSVLAEQSQVGEAEAQVEELAQQVHGMRAFNTEELAVQSKMVADLHVVVEEHKTEVQETIKWRALYDGVSVEYREACGRTEGLEAARDEEKEQGDTYEFELHRIQSEMQAWVEAKHEAAELAGQAQRLLMGQA